MRTNLAPRAVLLLLPFAAGCSCGDTRTRPGDAAGPTADACDACDAAEDAPSPDAGPDAADTAVPLDAYPPEATPDTGAVADVGTDTDAAPTDSGLDDGGPGPDAALDACAVPGCGDAGPDPDTGPVDSGPDAGCRPGLLGCLGPDGRLVCVDPLLDDCNCGACGVRGTCIGGLAIDDCPMTHNPCHRVCQVPYDTEWRRICTNLQADDTNCGACFTPATRRSGASPVLASRGSDGVGRSRGGKANDGPADRLRERAESRARGSVGLSVDASGLATARGPGGTGPASATRTPTSPWTPTARSASTSPWARPATRAAPSAWGTCS